MNANASPTNDTIPNVPTTTATVADDAVATVPAKAIALATTVVTSALDGLEALRLKARGAAITGLDYGDTVARNVSAASRRLVDQVDVATGAGLAKARTFALGSLERARTAVPVGAGQAATAPVASA
jgi:hypothetical protein